MHNAHATHHMRNHYDAIALVSKVACDAQYGASALARIFHDQVLHIYNLIRENAQESPAMRVENMGVSAHSCNFP
jgi:hypothetical protein